MAGGKQTPRQKMINMMYLVLMAMLALNVSIDVLRAFWSMNQTITSATEQWNAKNQALYAELTEKVRNNPVKYEPVLQVVNRVNALSDEYYNAIERYKIDMLRMGDVMGPDQTEIPHDLEDASALQSTSVSGEYFFPKGIYSEQGKQFIELTDKFRTTLSAEVKDPMLKQRIETQFSTGKIGSGMVKKEWLQGSFGDYPLGAVIAMLSQYQANIRQAQADVAQSKIGETLSQGIVFNTMQAIIIPQATTVMQGDNFKAEVMLAAYDNTQQPEVFLNGGGSVRVENGRGMVTIPATVLGQRTWGGTIRLKKDDGTTQDFPFQGSYDVTAPTAVVSPTQMNVVYRGVENPISVSVPGISANNITLQGPGLTSLGGGKYLADVTSVTGKEVTYTVSAKMADGSTKSDFPKYTFRIKNIPAPQGQIRGSSQPKLNKSAFAANKVEVVLPDFEFDVPMQVTGFTVKIEGKPSYNVSGNSFSQQVIQAVQSLPSNSEVMIRDIKYKYLKDSKIAPKEPTPIIVTVI